jgi:hypothetical protein
MPDSTPKAATFNKPLREVSVEAIASVNGHLPVARVGLERRSPGLERSTANDIK